jgi:hypothetical protein
MRIFHQVAERTECTNLTRQSKRTLHATLQHKKAENLSKKRQIPVVEAVQLLQASQERKDREDLTPSIRSSAPWPRISLETVLNSSLGRTCLENVMTDSISSSASEIENCVEKAGGTLS